MLRRFKRWKRRCPRRSRRASPRVSWPFLTPRSMRVFWLAWRASIPGVAAEATLAIDAAAKAASIRVVMRLMTSLLVFASCRCGWELFRTTLAAEAFVTRASGERADTGEAQSRSADICLGDLVSCASKASLNAGALAAKRRRRA